MKYTRDELTAKLVSMIEPMPTEHVMPPYESKVFARYSDHGLWTSTGGPWRVNIHAIEPLLSLDDAVRCVEAKYGPDSWDLATGTHHKNGKRVAITRLAVILEWDDQHAGSHDVSAIEYTNNNHALALALALASAVDGDKAEVTG